MAESASGQYPVPFFAVAVEDFTGEDEEELSVKQGTSIIVLSYEEDGWFYIMTKEKVGIFPQSYAEFQGPIVLPKTVRVLIDIPNSSYMEGSKVKVLEVTEDGLHVQAKKGSIEICSWDHVSLRYKRPQRMESVVSVIDCEPMVVEEEMEEMKALDPIAHASKIKKARFVAESEGEEENKEEEKDKEEEKAQEVVPTGPTRAKATKTLSSNTKSILEEMSPLRNPEERRSTYKRPVSIYSNYKIQSTYDVFDGDKYSMYKMPDANAPKYELEDRFEFRATEDVPPPPTFVRVEKKYITGDPSFIDFAAKERSAQFDI